MSKAMQEREEAVKESLEPLKLLVAQYIGNSPLSEDVIESYKICLSRMQHGDSLQGHLKLEYGHVELVRSLFEYASLNLELACRENNQIVLAHNGEFSCASCKSEKIRAVKLNELWQNLKEQQRAIQKLMALECAQRLLRLKPLEIALKKVQENWCAVENDLKTCPTLRCEKR
jgi:hypothetical protein